MYEEEGYRVVILSNQAGLTLHFDANHKGPKAGAQKRVSDFKLKCNGVLNQLNLPTTIYAATAKDLYRKPRVGMWKEMCEDYDISEDEIDLGASIFVGDAGGRVASVANPITGAVAAKKDFSCSDRNFAHNVGIEYKTPEEFFLGEKPREFSRDFDLASFSFVENGAAAEQKVFEKANRQDIVLFCGPPGAGKSTFFWTHLQPLGYERINQDILKSRDRCIKVAREYLQDGESVVIDNTNADADTRALWVELARKANIPIRCVWFQTPIHIAQHNDAVRSQNKVLNREGRSVLPPMAFSGFASRHKEPRLEEGFQDIVEMPFEFKGTKEEVLECRPGEELVSVYEGNHDICEMSARNPSVVPETARRPQSARVKAPFSNLAIHRLSTQDG
ncbi:Bifunctional polynucleotide phosphatase/kinase-like protein [Emericellopsis cladophorae]|uniref:Bifunctional polynucleotide phosphatase/kinase-like protein n=1 Tax=Emericellopsis cladophorae TaxID=2686198 RepID=A0A9Q0BBP6_9HYPO|nr:Bifunctional polynucleotide phosphatase/kinase-like protein [Emericellopsis cladophorae]KAI6778715.1 Bifunctional polynucleotide phosphatase/kinase-like protein [Emericellopsis cladophorae]